MPIKISPGQAGLIGAILAILFFATIVVLGFIQPGYNHFSNTISALVVGEHGWVQTVNLFILAGAFVFTGYGMGKNLTGRDLNQVFGLFLLFAVLTIFIALVPTDILNQQEIYPFTQLSLRGKIHYLFVLLIIVMTPALLAGVIKEMRLSPRWKGLVRITIAMLAFNFVVGLIWYVLVNFGLILGWKGLMQKFLAGLVIAWLVMVGVRVRELEKE